MNPKNNYASNPLRLKVTPLKLPGLISLVLLLLVMAGNVTAFEIAEWRFQTSLYTRHWDPDPEHVNHSKLLNIAFETTSGWIYGFAHFDNSFGQPSQYLYTGRSWPLFHQDWAYFKLTGGFLHGYKGRFKDKIPLNDLGVAPGLVPTFGLKHKRFLTELQILGNSAITVTAGFSFGHKSD